MNNAGDIWLYMFLLKEPTKNRCSLTAAHKCQMPNADTTRRPAADYFSWFWQSHQASAIQPPVTVSSGDKTISLHTTVHQKSKTPPTPYPLATINQDFWYICLPTLQQSNQDFWVQPSSYVPASNQNSPYIPLLQTCSFWPKKYNVEDVLLCSSHIC